MAARAPRRKLGPVEKAVRKDLRSWDASAGDGMPAVAVVLARQLDDGAGLATAAVARELRACLETLRPQETTSDDEFAQFLADLSAPVRNPEN